MKITEKMHTNVLKFESGSDLSVRKLKNEQREMEMAVLYAADPTRKN